MRTPAWVEHWDDERAEGNGVIVTLRYGYSFLRDEHLGVKGFDTVTEAKRGVRAGDVFRCSCNECSRR